MSIIPRTIVGEIEFFEQHLPIWAAAPTTIGLTAMQISDLTTLTAQARADYESAQAKRNSARAATETQNTSVASMHNLGADLVKTIRAFAETTDDPSVYTTAQIPAPAKPTPTPPPETPTDVAAVINNFGYVVISWKASRAVGTQFILQRQLTPLNAPPLAWTYAGSSVTDNYTDTTVPTGYAAVSYRVYAQRASGTSDASNVATLQFGSGLGTSSQSGEGSLSLAA